MAKYTTEVRSICETLAGYEASEGYKSVNEIITNSRQKIFSFDYPLFDATYKPVLEKKILKHYYGREIGAETFGRWQLWLDTKMNEIMPYYNKLYESELIEFNPMYDVDLTTDHTKEYEKTGEGKRNSISEDDLTKTITEGGTQLFSRETEEGGNETLAKNIEYDGTDTVTTDAQDGGTESVTGSKVDKNTRWDIFSDTPQGALTNVNNENYLTNARKITDDGTGSTFGDTRTFGKTYDETKTTDYGESVDETDRTIFGKTNSIDDTTTFGKTITERDTGSRTTNENLSDELNSTEDYIQHIVGKTGGVSYSKLLKEFRETFLNIDMMIINSLSDLFMGLW